MVGLAVILGVGVALVVGWFASRCCFGWFLGLVWLFFLVGCLFSLYKMYSFLFGSCLLMMLEIAVAGLIWPLHSACA